MSWGNWYGIKGDDSRHASFIYIFMLLPPTQFDISLVHSHSGRLAFDYLDNYNRLEIIRQVSDPERCEELVDRVQSLIQKEYPEELSETKPKPILSVCTKVFVPKCLLQQIQRENRQSAHSPGAALGDESTRPLARPIGRGRFIISLGAPQRQHKRLQHTRCHIRCIITSTTVGHRIQE